MPHFGHSGWWQRRSPLRKALTGLVEARGRLLAYLVSDGYDMSSQRILVVDDDASLRRVTQVQLEDEGYTVTVAVSGRTGIAPKRSCRRGTRQQP